jgi:multiple sugar transport system substrate-binding protein
MGRLQIPLQHVSPNSTNYNFMQQPLLSGDVLIAWDHVARLQDAFRQHPDDYVAFPAPTGPKGRFYMPVIVGLSVPKTAPDVAGAKQVIEYLLKPQTQTTTLRVSSFYPVTNAPIPSDLDPGLKAEMAAVRTQQSAPDAHPALLPVGLGSHSGEFDRIFTDTFQRIVIRGGAGDRRHQLSGADQSGVYLGESEPGLQRGRRIRGGDHGDHPGGHLFLSDRTPPASRRTRLNPPFYTTRPLR